MYVSPLENKIKKRSETKKITKVTSLLPKHTSKAYVTHLQNHDKIMNTKGPNI